MREGIVSGTVGMGNCLLIFGERGKGKEEKGKEKEKG
jgi:hypothetical protein